MERVGELLMTVMVDITRFNIEENCIEDNYPEMEGSRDLVNKINNKEIRNKENISRSVNIGIKAVVASLSEDSNWKVVQAKRRRDKEDLYRNNPSFDPIFMKV